jgi:hypothetical protein
MPIKAIIEALYSKRSKAGSESNGGDPTVVGMEEKYLIVSCGKP